ncbi:MAG: hypothetical protein KAJ19_26435 [Gammaproteobacteria bacterium]|nr:hypothetical protein [Gammaproteobacteria bacterium]
MKKLFLIFLLLPTLAYADSQTRYAGTVVSVGNKWTNATNAEGAGDNACAIYNSNKQDDLDCSGYSFSIPPGDVIDSINLGLDGYGNNATQGDRETRVQLSKVAGIGVGTVYSNIDLPQGLFCASSANRDRLGNIHWGTTWTATEINAIGFGVIIEDNDGTASELGIDAVPITVYHHTPEAEDPWLDMIQMPEGAGNVHDISDRTRIHHP